MSWHDIEDPVTLTVITSTFGTEVVENLRVLRATPANRCSAYDASTQVVTNPNTAALALDSEDFDTASMHDGGGANPERITIPAGGGGVYLCMGTTQVTTASGSSPRLHLRKNGTTVRRSRIESSSTPQALHVWAFLTLDPGDYVEIAGEAAGENATFGSATASEASRLEVVGPLPAAA